MKLSDRMLGYKTRVVTLHSLDEDDNTQYIFIPYDEYDGVATEVARLERVATVAGRFKAWMEEWYSVRGEVKKHYDIKEDDDLAQIYWALKELEE